MRRHLSTRGARGFTLIELVIAAMLAMLVIAGLYVVYASHARIFRGQEQVSQAQVGVRFAMEMIKEDLRRAGSLGVTDTNDPQVIQRLGRRPDTRIMAINLEHNQGYVPDVAPETNIATGADGSIPTQRPDRLTLVGNYTNNERYWVQRISGRTVTLQDTSLYDPTDPFPASEEEFNEIFAADNSAMLRIEHSNKVFFSLVEGRNYASKTVTIAESPSFLPGLWEGAKVNVVNKVVDPVANGLLTTTEENLAKDGNLFLKNRSDLVREVQDWTKGSALRTEVVAEYVVDFQVWFLFDEMELPDFGPSVDQRTYEYPDNWSGNERCKTGAIGTNNCLVKNAHGAIVRLSVRTSREDPNFVLPTVPPAKVRFPLQWYEVDPNSTGAARVRTLLSQVALTNIEFLNF